LAANEALYFGKYLENSLFSPQQICDNGLLCDPIPRQYNPTSLHGMHGPVTNLTVPFFLHGCISYVPIRLPTDTELQTCVWIELTSEAEWDPYDPRFSIQEAPHLASHPDIRIQSASSSMERRSLVDAPTLSRH
jgi:hypothetical protein